MHLLCCAFASCGLQRALEAYRSVEKLFADRTGQGFFGPNGLSFAAGLDGAKAATDQERSADAQRQREARGAAAAASSAGIVGGAAGDGDDAIDGNLQPAYLAVSDYIERLRSNIEAEVRQSLAEQMNGERRDANQRVSEAEHRMIGGYVAAMLRSCACSRPSDAFPSQIAASTHPSPHSFSEPSQLKRGLPTAEYQRSADAAVAARDQLEAWIRRSAAVEDTICSIVGTSTGGSGNTIHNAAAAAGDSMSSSSSAAAGAGDAAAASSSSAPAAAGDASDPDLLTNPLYTTDWHLLPSFVATLPRLAAVVGRMRNDVAGALRRRRLGW